MLYIVVDYVTVNRYTKISDGYRKFFNEIIFFVFIKKLRCSYFILTTLNFHNGYFIFKSDLFRDITEPLNKVLLS